MALAPPVARQGPGPIPASLVDALEPALAPRGSGLLPGDRRAPGAGLGTELAGLRAYRIGDDVRTLDAASSARTGTPHVRLHVPERTLTTWLVLDRSPSMAFGSADRLKSDVAEGVALVMGRLAVRRGGRLGVLSAGGPEHLLAPRGGPAAQAGLRKLLAEGVAVDGTPPEPLAPVLQRVGRLARHPGLVVIVSDFRGEHSEAWRRGLTSLGARHGLLAVEIRDPLEEALPDAGRLSLVDPSSGAVLDVDASDARLRERFARRAAAERDEVARALRAARARHVVLSTNGPWLRDLGRALR